MNGPTPRNPATAAGSDDRSIPNAIPVPTGTRDVLPEEMAELRAISSAVLKTFTDSGYGEVATPALEFEETMRIGDPAAAERVYRVPDKDGKVLIARFDSTIPIARLAATRYHDADPPLRFCYLQHVYRPIEPKRGQSREFLQIGMELLGLPAPEGDAEAIALLCRVLESAGLTDFRIAVGDVGFFPALLEKAGVNGSGSDSARTAILHELQTRDLVGLEQALSDAPSLSEADREKLTSVAAARGGREVIEREGAERLIALDSLLNAAGVADRVIYDLGLVRETGYYTGTVLEIYVPSSGFPVGGGGRYDDLVGRFGRDLAAFGFAINMERLHLAVLAEQEPSQ
ncbi:MAG TPA: ATP phosphoribosyltransferase regulatory subunit [Solirubrobacterales bacterium]|jgi:ATP phosphoribosyltransferase regulatory subunit|nr:ATP phosphoribosyltransferase regulatory subunit [Solirubrobacterales bacterium]